MPADAAGDDTHQAALYQAASACIRGNEIGRADLCGGFDAWSNGKMPWLAELGITFGCSIVKACALPWAAAQLMQGDYTGAALSVVFVGRIGNAAKSTKLGIELSGPAKRRLAKELVGIPQSAKPIAQGGSSKAGRWWEYLDSDGRVKIVVQHPDGTVHAGIPKPGSLHRAGGSPKFYDYGNFGHIGE